MADNSIFLTFRYLDDERLNDVRIPCNSFDFDKASQGGTYPNMTIFRDLDGMSNLLFQVGGTKPGFLRADLEIDKAGADGKPAQWSLIYMQEGMVVSDSIVDKKAGSKTEVLVLGYTRLKFDGVHNANGQTAPPNGQPWYDDTATVGG